MRGQLNQLAVCLVTGRFPALSEWFIYRKAYELARRGHRVTVLAREAGDSERFPEPRPRNLMSSVLPVDSGLRDPARALSMFASVLPALRKGQVRELYRRCRSDPRTRAMPARALARHLPFFDAHADLLHFEFLGIGAMYPLAGELPPTPTIVSCRGSDVHMFAHRPLPMQEAMRDCLHHATAVHCVSAELAGCVRALVGDRPHVYVNRPAVDLDSIAVRAAPVGDGPVRILATGRMTWVKGFDYLLTALVAARRRGLRFEATFLGGGELLAPLRFACTDLGLDDCVQFPGAVSHDEVLAAMQQADMFVLASHHEGISNAALEAMAAGVPVISTHVGGMPEAIRDDVEGLLVPPRDIEALASAIVALGSDPARRAAMGRAARSRIEAEFRLERQIDEFERIYRAVAGVTR